MIPYAQSPTGLDERTVGATSPAPGPENAWGAIVAPTLDPSRRPDVLNGDGSRSSLLSSSSGTDRGEMLYPGVSLDGRILGDDDAFNTAERSGQHFGIYASPEDATRAGVAMHNDGATQMKSPSFNPTSWNRADAPGVNYPSQAARDFDLLDPESWF